MTLTVAEGLYTVEEFLELDLFDDEENIYELIEGKGDAPTF
jgi:hypothetical protein